LSATPPGSASGTSRRLVDTLADDVRVVFEDVKTRGWSRSVGGAFTSLEAFYLTEDERRQLAEMKPLRRWLHRIGWFVRGLLMKLTPARRIMLALALVLLVLGLQRIEINNRRINLRFPITSSALLLFVLVLELKDKLTARDELEAGRKVQLALLPSDSPRVPGWDIWLYTQPANDVGGDLVDHLPIDGNRHAVALGDVAGKALPAALLSVKLQATIRALAPYFEALGDLGAGVNRILYRDGLPTRFASLVYLVLTAESGQIRVLNAGHMPPLLLRDGSATPMARGSMVLGIMPDTVFTEQSIDLVPGDLLVVYSDGVSEAMDEGGDFFGDERLFAVVQQASGLSAREAGERVLGRVKAFIGHAAASDDLSLMVLRKL
jgi:hypothetical protein